MFGSSDGQPVCGVVVDDLGDGGEGRAVLPEHVAPLCRPSELHMHETFTAPDKSKKEMLIKHSYGNNLALSDHTFVMRQKCPCLNPAEKLNRNLGF